MRARTKTVCWCALVVVMSSVGVITLMLRERCHKAHDWERNEVICCILEYSPSVACLPNWLWVDEAFYIEKETGIFGKKDVFFSSIGLMQYYIVENNIVKNYHWGIGNQKYTPLLDWLIQVSASIQPSGDERTKRTIVSNQIMPPTKLPEPVNEIKDKGTTFELVYVFNRWLSGQEDKFGDDAYSKEALTILKWSSLTNEPIDIISDFCESIMGNVNKPEYAGNNPLSWKSWEPKVIPYDSRTRVRKHIVIWDFMDISRYGYRTYPSYLRAVPLDEEELRLAQDIPVIDYDSIGFHLGCGVQTPYHTHNARCVRGSYHVTCAIRAPYLLIPIPEQGSPFPFLGKKYEPGRDKFVVKYNFKGQGFQDVCFLIETFKGEAQNDE